MAWNILDEIFLVIKQDKLDRILRDEFVYIECYKT